MYLDHHCVLSMKKQNAPRHSALLGKIVVMCKRQRTGYLVHVLLP